MALDGLLGVLAAVAVHVAHGQHLDVFAPAEVPLVSAHHQAHADQAHADAVVGRVLAQHGRGHEGRKAQRRPGQGGGLDELTTIQWVEMTHGDQGVGLAVPELAAARPAPSLLRTGTK